MSEMKPVRLPSLLERAAKAYDFSAPFLPQPANDVPGEDVAEQAPYPIVPDAVSSDEVAEALPLAPADDAVTFVAAPLPAAPAGDASVDRGRLAEQGLLVPGAPVSTLAEEFRLVKRQLLNHARAIAPAVGDAARMILVSSASPNEGKTYCSINLALSLAAERDIDVLLVDADVVKPDILAQLGIAERPGLLDAIAAPSARIEDFVVATDVPQLSLLPAGARSHQDTELIASARTRALLDELIAANPRRIILFDSPPVLAASTAPTLAHHVGQVMMVVRADRTGEADLRAAIGLLDGCEHIQLILNAVSFAPGGRRYGTYYGQETSA